MGIENEYNQLRTDEIVQERERVRVSGGAVGDPLYSTSTVRCAVLDLAERNECTEN